MQESHTKKFQTLTNMLKILHSYHQKTLDSKKSLLYTTSTQQGEKKPFLGQTEKEDIIEQVSDMDHHLKDSQVLDIMETESTKKSTKGFFENVISTFNYSGPWNDVRQDGSGNGSEEDSDDIIDKFFKKDVVSYSTSTTSTVVGCPFIDPLDPGAMVATFSENKQAENEYPVNIAMSDEDTRVSFENSLPKETLVTPFNTPTTENGDTSLSEFEKELKDRLELLQLEPENTYFQFKSGQFEPFAPIMLELPDKVSDSTQSDRQKLDIELTDSMEAGLSKLAVLKEENRRKENSNRPIYLIKRTDGDGSIYGYAMTKEDAKNVAEVLIETEAEKYRSSKSYRVSTGVKDNIHFLKTVKLGYLVNGFEKTRVSYEVVKLEKFFDEF